MRPIRHRCILAAAVAVVLALPSFFAADPGRVPEYDLKTVFLYNFAKFVSWPSDKLGPDTDTVRIGVLDMDRVADSLHLVAGKTAKNRPVTITLCRTPEEAGACHIVFFNSADEVMVRRILAAVVDKPVLTVGEAPGFRRWGGIINFRVLDNRVRLVIDLQAARRARLHISAQLLEVAMEVRQ